MLLTRETSGKDVQRFAEELGDGASEGREKNPADTTLSGCCGGWDWQELSDVSTSLRAGLLPSLPEALVSPSPGA